MLSSPSDPARPAAALPRAGQSVRWRDPRHADALGWSLSYGPGPFRVVAVVEKTAEGVPPTLVLATRLGEKEVNSVWLVPVEAPGDLRGYSDDALESLVG